MRSRSTSPAAEEARRRGSGAVEEAAVEKEGAGETADAASYHETTLDDLEATKMSTTQKVIIAVAVAGIVRLAAGTFWPLAPWAFEKREEQRAHGEKKQAQPRRRH